MSNATLNQTVGATTSYSSAAAARKAGDYKVAVEMYSDMRDSSPARFSASPWNLWGLGYSLNALGRNDEALEACRELYRDYADFTPGRELYARCIYRNAFPNKGEQPELASQIKAAEAILEITPQVKIEHDTRNFCWSAQAVLKLLSRLAKEENAASLAEDIIKWTDSLKPELLDSKSFEFKGDGGKRVSCASPLEQWYAHRAKALFNADRYEECAIFCEEAIAKLEGHLNNGNEIWLRRLAAKAHAELGDKEKALGIYNEIVRQKDEWFLWHERAVLLQETDKAASALAEASCAALAPGNPALKVKLFSLIADLLLEAGRDSDATAHARLVRDIYRAQRWPLTKLLPFLKRHNAIVLETNSQAMPDMKSCNKMIKALSRDVWSNLRFAGQEKRSGVIRNILPNGKAGFIVAGKKKRTFYFALRDFMAPTDKCKQGTPVTFFLQEGFDRKKNRPVQNATQVALAEEIAQ